MTEVETLARRWAWVRTANAQRLAEKVSAIANAARKERTMALITEFGDEYVRQDRGNTQLHGQEHLQLLVNRVVDILDQVEIKVCHHPTAQQKVEQIEAVLTLERYRLQTIQAVPEEVHRQVLTQLQNILGNASGNAARISRLFTEHFNNLVQHQVDKAQRLRQLFRAYVKFVHDDDGLHYWSTDEEEMKIGFTYLDGLCQVCLAAQQGGANLEIQRLALAARGVKGFLDKAYSAHGGIGSYLEDECQKLLVFVVEQALSDNANYLPALSRGLEDPLQALYMDLNNQVIQREVG